MASYEERARESIKQSLIKESEDSRQQTRRLYRRTNRIINNLNLKYSELDAGEKAEIAMDEDRSPHPFHYEEDTIYDSDRDTPVGSPRRKEDDPDFQFDCPYTDATYDNTYR